MTGSVDGRGKKQPNYDSSAKQNERVARLKEVFDPSAKQGRQTKNYGECLELSYNGKAKAYVGPSVDVPFNFPPNLAAAAALSAA